MDYRTAVNPTYYTAQATLFMLAGAGNTDAQEFIRDMGIQNTIVDKGKGQASPLSEADLSALKVGTGLAVEARYAAISRLLGKGDHRNVLDIACGFTPRSLFCHKAGIDYVGMDVPVVAEQLQAYAGKKYPDAKHATYVGGDATNAASLEAAADLMDGELFISCEGLMGYLSRDEQEQFIGGIRAVLAKHGGAWYTTDFGVDYEQFAARNMPSPEAAALYQTAKKQSMQQSNIFNGVFVLKTEAEKQAFLEANGLKVEKLPFYHGDENLQMLHAVLPEKKDAMLDQLGKSTFWKMTLDTSAFVREKIAGAKEVDNLRIDYAIEGNVLSCSPTGRIDTISAPVLLEILEQNGAGLKEMKLDASNLEYISSAGLRVLLMAVKKLGRVTVSNASEAVKEIFETTGFDQMMSVE